MLKITDDGILIEDQISISKDTTMEEVENFGVYGSLEVAVVNGLYKSWVLNTGKHEVRFYFESTLFTHVSVTILPWSESTDEAIDCVLDELFGGRKKMMNKVNGMIMAKVKDRFCGICAVDIRFNS